MLSAQRPNLLPEAVAMARNTGLHRAFSEDLPFGDGTLPNLLVEGGLTQEEFGALAAELSADLHGPATALPPSVPHAGIAGSGGHVFQGKPVGMIPNTSFTNTPPPLASTLLPLPLPQPPETRVTPQEAWLQTVAPALAPPEKLKSDNDAFQVAAASTSKSYNSMLSCLPPDVQKRAQQYLLFRTSQVWSSGVPLLEATMVVQQEILPLLQQVLEKIRNSGPPGPQYLGVGGRYDEA